MLLKLGKEAIDLPVDDHDVLLPKELQGVKNLQVEIDRALEPLEKFLQGAKRISILVSDITRPSHPSFLW